MNDNRTDFNQFTNLYSLSKTLRFSLEPEPKEKTLENLGFIKKENVWVLDEKNSLLGQDKERADDYKKVKGLIDDYIKDFIEKSLSHLELNKEDLENFEKLYKKKGKNEEERICFDEIKAKLRGQIADYLKNDPCYPSILKESKGKGKGKGKKVVDHSSNASTNPSVPEVNKKKEKGKSKKEDNETFFFEHLYNFVEEDDRRYIDKFKKFTTYFRGFNENRKNLFTEEAQATAIAYRLVHDNLPKFIDNMQCFEAFKDAGLADKLPELYASLGAEPGVGTIDEMFRLDYYSRLLTQSHIDIYNAVIGGKTTDKEKIQGLNELVNLYNQQQTDRSMRLPLFKPLFKQILSDRGSLSWLPEQFGSDNEVLESIEACYIALEYTFSSLKQLLKELGSYNLSQVYVDYAMLPPVSQQIADDWSAIYRALDAAFMRENPKKEEETDPEYEERRQKYFKNKDACSIAEVDAALETQKETLDKQEEALEKQNPDAPHALVGYFSRLGEGRKEGKAQDDLFTSIAALHDEAEPLLAAPYPEEKNLAQDKVSVEKLKNLLDAVKALQHFVAPLAATAEQPDKDERFYGQLMPLWLSLGQITPLYNKVRDYLTRKPYSVEKIKLNFECPTLMGGWAADDKGYLQYKTLIFRKAGIYYLGIIAKGKRRGRKGKKGDEYNARADGSERYFEKMEYRFAKPALDFNNRFFTDEKGIKPTQEIRSIKERKEKTEEDHHALIDFFKSCLEVYPNYKKFGFRFAETSEYNTVGEFLEDARRQAYGVSFSLVREDDIYRLVDEGKLYLFKIYSKDFSPKSKGTPNLHTIYWRMLFDPRNLADVSFQLNGHGEVFYRKPSLQKEPEKPTHPAGRPIANKRADATKKESCFAYDLIKDKRFTERHFELHVPITLNFKSRQIKDINQMVKEYIHDAADLHVIGIDRGERNLLYLSLIDMQGRIVKQQSLNSVGETDYYASQGGIAKQESPNEVDRTDYHALLEKREVERQKARRSWQTIESIKELKEGYLSQVVRVVANWMVEYHAIVALENLNFGFKRGRQKVEKQVYQKFEKMLTDKLCYLVDKTKDADEPGGALRAYQLAKPLEKSANMGFQNGFLFYVPAWNTSKIDPVTGFVNLFDTRYENEKKARNFFDRFDAIHYNETAGLFEFVFQYRKFPTKAESTRNGWTLCSHGERIEAFKDKAGHWDTCTVNLTEELKKLFKHYGIALDGDLRAAISRQTDKKFFQNDKREGDCPRGLMQLFRLMVQMRNSEPGTNTDYLISPVADAQGRFFDSREVGDDLPKDADANGAYNIARKGLWLVRKIKEDPSFKKMTLTNQEWLSFAQEKPYEG